MTNQTEALAELIAALEAHLHPNDYCGYEVSKHHASTVADAIEAARAALSSQPPAPREDDLVMVPRGLIGAACAAITKKHDATKTLEQLRRYTVGDLSHPS